MKSKRKTPDIRFRGFTDDWEHRKFEEVFDLSITNNSLSRSQLNYDDGVIKNIHYGDILVNYPTILNHNKEKIPYITDAKVDLYMDRLLKNGDIIFADASEDTTTGKAVEVNGLADEMLVSGLHTIVARPKINASPGYIGYYINSDSYHRKLVPLLQGTKVLSISKSTLRETSVVMSKNREEQTNIAMLFKNIDKSITLHQRKLQQLKEVKRGMLLKILPSYKNMNPSIRFNEDFDWRNEKLEFLITKNSEKNKELLINYVESISNKTGFTSQILQFEDYSVASKNLSNYYIIREKCFAYNPSRINVGSIAYKHKGDQSSVVSPLYVSFYTNQSLEDLYLWYWLKGQEFDRQREVYSEGGVRDTLSYNQLKEIKISYPDKKEQKLIGSLFEKLDRMIELQESEIELLEETKKGFLQKMFV